MQKLKELLGILSISLIMAVSLSAQNSGSFGGQVIQPDGKILIWGANMVISGVPSGMVARLNPNGSRDKTFNFCGCQFLYVNRLVLQTDGKVLVSGNKENGGSPFMQQRLVRIDANGNLDSTFAPYDGSSASSVYLSVEGVQPDGKILAYSIVDAGFPFGASTNVRRLNPNGSLDSLSIFIGQGQFFRTYMGTLEMLPDGKFYISTFPSISAGIPTLKRYNADGSLDSAFVPPTFLMGFDAVYAINSQSNGDIIVGGGFSQINGVAVKNLARLSSTGVVDATFVPPNIPLAIYQVNVLPDGKILILEQLTGSPSYTYAIRRLNSNGSLDGTFVQSPFINNVGEFSLDAQGRIVFAGSHSSRGPGYYRLNPNGDLDGTFIFGFTRRDFDFDGDGKADVGVFRPSEGNWYLSQSQNGFSVQNFGLNSDVLTPGDFDGDGKSDLAIWRPSTGTWWYKSSVNNGFYAVQWGQAGDIPLAEDFNGDGKADFVFYRPSNGGWYRLSSSAGFQPVSFGTTGDIPLIGDFDADGKADPAIFRPSTGVWWYQSSINNLHYAFQWGINGDIPVPGDYDGDGKTDFAVFRPSDTTWYIFKTSNNSFNATAWGFADDRPAPADYDGDGKTDIAIYRPSNGMWFALRSTSGFFSQQFGLPGDKAVPNAFIP